VWGNGTPQYLWDVRYCDIVRSLSKGRLDITPYGVGQLAQVSEVFDLVANGTVEAGADAAQYWSGKNTAFDLLGVNVMGMSGIDYFIWTYASDGLDQYQGLFAKYGLKYFPTAISTMESGLRSTSKISSLNELKGKKVRMSGLIVSKLLQELGVTPVSMTLAEATDGLSKGVIDALEYSSPYADESMQIYEIAKFWLAPGFHQTAAPYGVFFNMKSFDSLPDDLKEVAAIAAKAVSTESLSAFIYRDALATQNMVQKYGVTITRLSNEELLRLERIKNKIYEQLAAENPDFAKIAKSQMDYFKNITYYQTEFLGEFSYSRLPKEYPNLK